MKKNKIVDKKIIFLFLIMLVMIVFMFYFMSQQSNNEEEILSMANESKAQLLKRKEKEINTFLKDNQNLLSQGFQEIFKKLNFVSYIDLPLKIKSDRNNYPFGNGLNSE